ncbi:MAG: hypothetical protein IM638_04415 [Bacteroidetes bacterium]|nr:hypothetical protein [Bacteroidota bacterium]
MKLLSFINLKREQLFLFLLPAVVAVLGVMHIKQHPISHYTSSDPAYAYLMNGLTLATGSFDIGHTDNPGTTVQVFQAVVIRIVYLFRSAPSVVDDVVANPEVYIMAGRTGMFIINTLLLMWLGFFVWKHSGKKMGVALLMQCMLFFSQFLIIYFTLLMPEAFLISGGIVLSGICIHMLYCKELTHARKIRYAIAFSIVTAFMAVTKFPAVVLFAIPLFLLSGNIYKLIYLTGAFICTALFVLPAKNKIAHFFQFLFGILTHKGRYGSGEEGFVNKNDFTNNLYTHYLHNKIYIILLIVCALLLIAGFIRYKKWMAPNALKFRLLGGILIAAAANLAMASKEFAYHYLISVQILSGLALLTALLTVFSIWPQLKLKLQLVARNTLLIPAVCVFSVVLLYPHRVYYNFNFQPQDHSAEVIEAFNAQGKLPAIFSSTYCNGPSPICGFRFGLAFSGDIRMKFAARILKYYPDSWIFNSSNGEYDNFLETALTSDFTKRYPRFLFYIHSSDTLQAYPELKKLAEFTDANGNYVETKRVYRHPVTKEEIWLITSDTTRAGKRFNLIATINSDFETTLGDSVFTSSQKSIYIGNANLKTTTQARSGKTSLAFSSKEAYAGGLELAVAKGFNYEVSIWCKGNTYSRSLNLKSSKINISIDKPYEKTPDGWEKLSIKFSIPNDFEEDRVKIFLWNYDNNGETVWWDDMEIKVFQ